jgi:uncharacterized membrane protein YcaP (DUF421 family)
VDLNLIWKAALIIIVGTALLRFAGRKSVSQMTIAQTVLMVAIGTLLIQPVVGKNIWATFAVGAILVLTLLVMEYAQVKLDSFETLVTGKSKVLIENGVLNEENMRKVKLTVDQLEMNLRQKNVQHLTDVQWATMEVDGKIGFVLKEAAQPVTKKEFQQLNMELQQTLNLLRANPNLYPNTNATYTAQTNNKSPVMQRDNLFTEVDEQGHQNPPPEHLQ